MLGSGAIPRPTSFPVLTPPARGGKGDLEFSGRWSSALSRGDGSVGPAPLRAEEHHMTRQKSFKGRVRARMDKTSESYTAAAASSWPRPPPTPLGPSGRTRTL